MNLQQTLVKHLLNASLKPLQEIPSLRLFLGQIDKELFEITKTRLGSSNYTKNKWECMRSLVDARSIVQPREVFYKKISKISLCPREKNLCWGLFFIKFQV